MTSLPEAPEKTKEKNSFHDLQDERAARDSSSGLIKLWRNFL